jgi:hypothetical protein
MKTVTFELKIVEVDVYKKWSAKLNDDDPCYDNDCLNAIIKTGAAKDREEAAIIAKKAGYDFKPYST